MLRDDCKRCDSICSLSSTPSVKRLKTRLKKITLFLVVISLCVPVLADVVKPALVEISVSTDERVEIEIRTSLEALLTGINGRYRNTQDAPNSDAYDQLRELPPEALAVAFEAFHDPLLQGLWLEGDGLRIPLEISAVEVGPTGYTKVPRPSVIRLQGRLPRSTQAIQWYYPLAFSDQAVRVRQVDLVSEKWHWSPHQWIREDQPTEPFSLQAVFSQPSALSIAETYLDAGFVHIIPRGLDHIFFIFGIFLMSMRLKPLLWQATMFTVAHSVTLSLGVFGWISLPAQIVEPLIALSIGYVALENIVFREMTRLRLPVVFAFGLLHGMGFASTLTDFGLPNDAYLWALLWFNLGVEAGQVTILLCAYLTLTVWFTDPDRYRRWVVLPGSLAVSAVGLMWFVERVEFFTDGWLSTFL